MTKIKWVERAPFAPAGYLCRVFQANVEDGHLSVFVGKEAGKWHLSISHRSNSMVNIGGAPLM